MKSKLFIILLLSSVAFGSKEDFPSFDTFHCNCAMDVTYPNESCTKLFEKLESTIKQFKPEPDAQGTYDIMESKKDDYLWTTRTTPVKKYVDDIMFETV